MFFFFIVCIFSIKFTKILHDCSSNNFDPYRYHNESIDYQINCPQEKIQKIKQYYSDNIKYISIFNESNVLLEGSSDFDHFEKLIIFNFPKITFDNKFIFDKVEIYGSPNFSFATNSLIIINQLYLYNQSYIFPSDSKHIKTSHINGRNTITNKNKKSKEKIIQECNEKYFLIELYNDGAGVFCGSGNNGITLKYPEFSNYKFNVVHGRVVIDPIGSEIKGRLYETMEYIAPSLAIFTYGRRDVIFNSYPYGSTISRCKNLFDEYLDFWIRVERNGCEWDPKESVIYNDWKTLMSDPDWRKVCINIYTSSKNIMFHYYNSSNDKKVDIIVIPKETFNYIMIGAAALILFIFLTLLIIAYVMKNKSDNDASP